MTVLRAVQKAFAGRDVQFLVSSAPLQQVGPVDARLAPVGADAFHDLSRPAPTRSDRYEAVDAVGQTLVHLLGARDGPGEPNEITKLAVGPEGTASNRTGTILKSGLGLDYELVIVDGDRAAVIQAVI